jgi:TonB family protein
LRVVECHGAGYRPRMRFATLLLLVGLALSACSAGCGRRPARAERASLPRPLPIAILSDTAIGAALPLARFAAPTTSRLTLLRVTRSRAGAEPPLPVPEPEAPPVSEEARERLPVDDALRPPMPLGATTLHLPGVRAGVVVLDVRVDEDGAVTDAQPAEDTGDSALAQAAIEAALRVRYRPATLAGRPVAVWCRQRFEIGR